MLRERKGNLLGRPRFEYMLSNEVKKLLEDYDLAPSKKRGQYFLINEGVCKKIIHFANALECDTFVEIGPGLGALTQLLSQKAKRVVAVEIDKGFVRFLKNRFAAKLNVEVTRRDILDFAPLFDQPYAVVGNIPYNISSLIVEKFLQKERVKPAFLLITVQEEFAKRLVALVPRMNRLSLLARYYATPKMLAHFPPRYFWPQPKVHSTLLSLELLRSPRPLRAADEMRMWQGIKEAFRQPRKMLKNALPLLDSKNLKTKRPQELSLDDWVGLYARRNERK